ncbi:hypothetical protein TIFTF001_050464, partial [Ficus carica]
KNLTPLLPEQQPDAESTIGSNTSYNHSPKVVIPNRRTGLVWAEPEDFLARSDDTFGTVCRNEVPSAKGNPLGLFEDLACCKNAEARRRGLVGKVAHEFS